MLLRSCNVKWIRVQVGTQSGKWSKQLNKWIKNDHHQNVINLIFIRGVSMYRFASLRTLYISLQKVTSRPASIWRKIKVRKVIKYVIDDVWGVRCLQIWSEELIVEKKVLPGFLHSHERDESIVLFRDMKKKSREGAEDRDFSLLYPRKVFQW